MDAAAILITVVAGVAMGAINNVAGGAGIFALWAFQYACGLPLAIANPSSRLGAIGVGLFAWIGFVRHGVRADREAWRLALFAIPGAFVGNLLALKANPLAFHGYLVVALVVLLVQQLRARSERPQAPSWLGPLGCTLVGLHMGFAQIGTGFVATLVLLATYHHDLLHVNVAKSVVVITSSVASFVGFVLAPYVLANQAPVIAWAPAACLATGTATGSYLASKWTIDKGAVAVRRAAMAIAVLALFHQLFEIWLLLAH